MIEINNITKKFGSYLALDQVSAVFSSGKINLIIGKLMQLEMKEERHINLNIKTSE